MSEEASAVQSLRKLVDAIENGDGVSATIAWIYDDKSVIEALTFGPQALIDALTMHLIRIRVLEGPRPHGEETQH